MTPSDLTGLPDNILRKMVEEARAEAARQALLVQRYEPAHLGLPHVVRERDEAWAALKRAEEAEARFRSEWAKKHDEVARLREALGELVDREELNLKHAYTTCDFGDSTNADRGCIWCVARAALQGEGK